MNQETVSTEGLNACRIDSSDKIANLAPALVEAQKKMGSAKKEADNPFFKSKYADYNSVLSACKDQLNDAGIVILQPTSVDGDKILVSTLLLHESGEWIRATMIALEAKDMQKMGSAVSYAARYTLQRLVALPSSEDDDGEKSVGRGGSSQSSSKGKSSGESKSSSKESKESSGSSSSGKRGGFGMRG